MDKNWINKNRTSDEYKQGVIEFLNFAFQNSSSGGKILCPCIKCGNCSIHTREEVRIHLICDGFLRGYTTWICHGEDSMVCVTESSSRANNMTEPVTHRSDNVDGLLHDIFGSEFVGSSNAQMNNGLNIQDDDEDNNETNIGEDNIGELLNDMNTNLYPGCKNHSKLSYLLHLYHLKCLNGWSDKSFSMLLELQNKSFPEGVSLPKSSYEAKKIIHSLGLDYQKINTCPNDCKLYWKDKKDDQFCENCELPWWKVKSGSTVGNEPEFTNNRKKQPAKVFRYFPLIPRLKRYFASAKIAGDVRWHNEGRKKDGLLRHPADGLAWKSFDELHPDFASDPRNLRIALSSDGFNPFKKMSTTYSTWPVVLIIYNFPPWVCMKQSSFILSMIIPGEKSPGNDIDIYFPPLIDELMQLWKGVEVYDASTKETFKLRAALMGMIHDFPAYGNLSGWSTKGEFACPCCVNSTSAIWLKNSHKYSFMGHRRWLPQDHTFRFQKDYFDGSEEHRMAPSRPSGSDILEQLNGVEFKFGKTTQKSKKRNRNFGENSNERFERAKDWWKKKSIFFELPYWKHNLLRHNLDVMHIEKNVCDNILGTLLGISKKSKDNLKARLDLIDLDIRSELHPQVLANGKSKIPPACFTLSTIEKDSLLKILHGVKLPDGYSSNISRCINLKDSKITGLKSHDCHILLQDLLPIALKSCGISKEVTSVIVELSSFFKSICSKVLDLKELDKLQERIILTLCRMERIFLPSFFTVMVHLVIHLVEEVKLGGPVQYRWMYPLERYFVGLKSKVKNRSHPEGSIAEGYIAEECMTFCSRYLSGVETVFNRALRNPEPLPSTNKYLFSSEGYPIGATDDCVLNEMKIAQIQRYVLRHCDGIDPFRSEYIEMERRRRRRSSRLTNVEKERLLNEEFPAWLKKRVMANHDQNISDDIMDLGLGPNKIAKRYSGFTINGIRFHTANREVNRSTQNSGVVNSSEIDGINYFGRLRDIIEVSYHGSFKVVLFKCDWVDVHHNVGIKQDMGYTLVNFSRLIHTGDKLADEPYVFSSQVQQVFYMEDPNNANWFTVVRIQPRDRFDMVEKEVSDDTIDYGDVSYTLSYSDDILTWIRTDLDGEIVDS